MNQRMKQGCAIGMMLWLSIVSGAGAEKNPSLDQLVGQVADLAPWAYAYRADLKVQEKPEAYFVPRILERLDDAYRPVSLLLSFDDPGNHQLLPRPSGVLQSALLWEGRVLLNRVELHWPKNEAGPPPLESVEVRVYPAPFGWFGWQGDRRVTVKPAISQDGLTWVYQGTQAGELIPTEGYPPPKGIGLASGGAELGLNPNEVGMVAVFVQPCGKAQNADAKEQAKCAVPLIRAYGPEKWNRMDVEIEWGFKEGTQKADFDGRVEGFFGLVGNVAPLPGDTQTTIVGPNAWESHAGSGSRRGIAMSLLYIQPAVEYVGTLPRFPYGDPRDTRITVWTQSGNFTFLVRDLEEGPILAPEYGFFVTNAGSGKTARKFSAELAASKTKSIREMTREHREATWDEATREITLPMLPQGTALPPYKPVSDPPMQVQVPEARWVDAWRSGVSKMQKGELTYMELALEAPRPIHAMDLVGLHDTAAQWLESFLQRPGAPSDGDFNDGSGNFSAGKLFHGSAIINQPGYKTYELVHNGGTGRILYDLAEHYFLTGDAAWFKKNQWRMQAAAEWIIRQRNLYMKDIPNRSQLWVAGLHPPQHIADCAWGESEWKWYANIDAWYYQGLRRFAEAMAEIDPNNAGKYLDQSAQYRQALQRAVDRSITLAPVMRVRNGTYRSYIPPISYIRGPSIGQVTQIAMTDDDWPLEMVDSAGIPAADDARLDGDLDVYEDVMALKPKYVHGGNRYQFLTDNRHERNLSSGEDWFWGGFSPQLGYSYLADVYLRRDEISSFLRQWINNYAAFVMPTPEYYFLEHCMNHTNPDVVQSFKNGEYKKYIYNGHALSYFMEEFRSLLVWEDGNTLWLAKATPRHWLEQGKRISVKDAPTYFGTVSYEIASDVSNGKITATLVMPSRNPPKSVFLRFRHPDGAPIKSVEVDGKTWKNFDKDKEVVRLEGLQGKILVRVSY